MLDAYAYVSGRMARRLALRLLGLRHLRLLGDVGPVEYPELLELLLGLPLLLLELGLKLKKKPLFHPFKLTDGFINKMK